MKVEKCRSEQRKEYRERNKEAIKERAKEYYRVNKNRLKESREKYRKDNVEYMKEYRARNKERLREVNSEYISKSKDKISKKQKEFDSSCNGKFSDYKSCAKQRDIEFIITKEEFSAMWQQPCSYCGLEIFTIGIDRVDNNIGYEINNCISCCSICNTMKLNHSKKEWFDHMIKILKKQGVKI